MNALGEKDFDLLPAACALVKPFCLFSMFICFNMHQHDVILTTNALQKLILCVFFSPLKRQKRIKSRAVKSHYEEKKKKRFRKVLGS